MRIANRETRFLLLTILLAVGPRCVRYGFGTWADSRSGADSGGAVDSVAIADTHAGADLGAPIDSAAVADSAVADSAVDVTNWTWTSLLNTPVVAGAAVAVVLGDGLHVIGGATDYGGLSRYVDHHVYQGRALGWSRRASITDNNTYNAQAHSYGGRLYFIGGWPGNGRLRRYDPARDEWERLTDSPIQYQYGFVSAVVAQVLYVVGGELDPDVLSNAPCSTFDLRSEIWSSCKPIPLNATKALAGAALGSKIYIINGDSGGGDSVLQIYDTVADSWDVGAALHQHFEASAAVAYSGRLYFFGGSPNQDGSGAVTAAVNIYDPISDSWSTGPRCRRQGTTRRLLSSTARFTCWAALTGRVRAGRLEPTRPSTPEG